MALTLSKGQSLSLDKTSPGLTRVRLGLGWDAQAFDSNDFDLDASAFLVKADRKVRSNADFIFYNQMGDVTLSNERDYDPDRASVMYQGDNRTGAGDGDDETIIVELNRVPADVEAIAFTVTIHEAAQRRQNFGQVRNSFIRLIDDVTNEEIAKYDLAEDYGSETALVFAELYRHNGEWKFKAIGDGFNNGLEGIIGLFGVVL